MSQKKKKKKSGRNVQRVRTCAAMAVSDTLAVAEENTITEEKNEPALVSEDMGRNPDGTFAKGNVFAEKYDDSFADELIRFFSKPLTRIEYKKTYFKDGTLASEEPKEFIGEYPTMGMFARHINVSVSALKAWAGITEEGKYKHDRFASAYACVKEWSAGMIESGALSGKLDSNMAKFVLTNDYGKQDKQVIDTNITGVDEKDLELIRRVEARLGKKNAESDN